MNIIENRCQRKRCERATYSHWLIFGCSSFVNAFTVIHLWISSDGHFLLYRRSHRQHLREKKKKELALNVIDWLSFKRFNIFRPSSHFIFIQNEEKRANKIVKCWYVQRALNCVCTRLSMYSFSSDHRTSVDTLLIQVQIDIFLIFVIFFCFRWCDFRSDKHVVCNVMRFTHNATSRR